jgi:hypothetical protein
VPVWLEKVLIRTKTEAGSFNLGDSREAFFRYMPKKRQKGEIIMGFDAKKFLKTKFTPRTDEVPVPDLQAFFPEGAKAVWTVRGLTGQEVGRANEAAERNKNIAAILEGLTAESAKDKAEALKELLGIGGNTTADIAKRLEHLTVASVDPKCTLDLAVRICEVFPVEFFQITNKITILTGQGQMPGKQQPSGATGKSGPASPLATPGGDFSTS